MEAATAHVTATTMAATASMSAAVTKGGQRSERHRAGGNDRGE